ncbi:hypothetical protein PR048_008115 [Dryococelus australis]|uniref:Uncharacterized protein n=1 Tax=Dryococelus australis TaxID=614101 RepID=A0ABQ9HXU6_9NEOP|nr:hypothetical protein PR048_008115 [Dryococelus australis]
MPNQCSVATTRKALNWLVGFPFHTQFIVGRRALKQLFYLYKVCRLFTPWVKVSGLSCIKFTPQVQWEADGSTCVQVQWEADDCTYVLLLAKVLHRLAMLIVRTVLCLVMLFFNNVCAALCTGNVVTFFSAQPGSRGQVSATIFALLDAYIWEFQWLDTITRPAVANGNGPRATAVTTHRRKSAVMMDERGTAMAVSLRINSNSGVLRPYPRRWNEKSMDQRRNKEYKVGENGISPRKTRRPVASSGAIPTPAKLGSDPVGNRTRFACVGGECSSHCANCSPENKRIWSALNNEVLRAEGGEVRWITRGAGMHWRGKREIPLENPLTSGIVRNDSHAGNRTRLALVGGK